MGWPAKRSGLRDAGLEPFFYEDTRHTWEAFDPVHRTSGADYEAGIALAGEAFSRAGFGDSWAFFDAQRNKWAGAGRDAARAALANARILLNAGGVHRFGAPERAGKTNVYIDMDPAYTQIHLAGGDRGLRDLLGEHDVHFTFGENIGSSNCRVPTGGIRWHPTRQPVALDFWATGPVPPDAVNVALYAVPTMPAGSVAGEIDNEIADHSRAVVPAHDGLCGVPLAFLSVTSPGRGSVLRYQRRFCPAVVDIGMSISD